MFDLAVCRLRCIVKGMFAVRGVGADDSMTIAEREIEMIRTCAASDAALLREY